MAVKEQLFVFINENDTRYSYVTFPKHCGFVWKSVDYYHEYKRFKMYYRGLTEDNRESYLILNLKHANKLIRILCREMLGLSDETV